MRDKDGGKPVVSATYANKGLFWTEDMEGSIKKGSCSFAWDSTACDNWTFSFSFGVCKGIRERNSEVSEWKKSDYL